MKKSWLQYSIGVGSVAITLLTFFGNTTRHFSTLTGWLTYPRAAQITGIVIALVGAVLLLIKFRVLRWIGKKGERLRIKKLDNSIYLALALLVLACWLTAFMNARQPTEPAPVVTADAPSPFDRSLKNFKVLIMPFRKECDYLGKKYNVGLVMQQRLENLRRTDSLDIQTYYYADTSVLGNFTDATADSLMKRYGANQILYGTYSLKECEGGSSDKICFSHKTDYKQLHLGNAAAQMEYKMLNIDGLEDIRKGTGQESIDYLIYFVSGSAEYRNGKYTSAIRHYRQIKDYQHKAAVLFEIGNCYLLMKDHSTARQYFDQALAINPAYGEALAHVSAIALEANQADSARYLIERAIKADPKNSCIIKGLGDFHLAMKDTVKAKVQYEQLVREYAGDDVMLISIAKVYSEMKDYIRARELLIQATHIHPGHPGIWDQLGLVFIYLKRDDTAMLCFKNALAFNNDDAFAYYCMGMIYLKEKDACNAIEQFTQATASDPRLQEAWTFLSDSYRMQNDEQAAIDCLEEALQYDPSAEKVLKHAAGLYTRLRRYDAAGIHYATLARLHPDNTQYLLQLGACYASQGQYRATLDCYQKLYHLQPYNGQIRYRIARTFSQLHQAEQALNHLSAAVGLAEGLKKAAREDGAFGWLSNNKRFALLVR